MREVYGKLNEYRMDEGELLSAQQIGVTWHHLDGSSGKHQTERNGETSYRESDWSAEVDDVKMWHTFRSMEDWTSRLNLIMSRATPNWR